MDCYVLPMSSKGKGLSSHPVEQLLCSSLPQLLFLQESLEAVADNSCSAVPQGSLSPFPGEGETLTVALSEIRARQATMPWHCWQHGRNLCELHLAAGEQTFLSQIPFHIAGKWGALTRETLPGTDPTCHTDLKQHQEGTAWSRNMLRVYLQLLSYSGPLPQGQGL